VSLMSKEYERGFEAGYARAMMLYHLQPSDRPKPMETLIHTKVKRKKPQKGKAKLLTDMTAPKWKKYKKGSGKKTYVQIRAQVARSQDYKRACKRKGFK